MLKFIHHPFSYVNNVRELIAIKFLSDDITRALSSDSGLTFATLKESWAGYNNRAVSSAVRKVLGVLRGRALKEGIGKGTLGPVMEDLTKKLTRAETILESMSKWIDADAEIQGLINKRTELSDNKDAIKLIDDQIAEKKKERQSADMLINELWAASGVMDFIALKDGIASDLSDPMNDVLTSQLLTEGEMFGSRWETFVDENFSSYRSSGGLKVPKTPDLYDFNNLFLTVQYASFTPTNGVGKVSLAKLLSGFGMAASSEQDPTLQDVYAAMSRLDDLEMVSLIERIPSILPNLEKVSNTKASDNKQINTILTEATRVQKVYQVQLFHTLSTYLAFIQLHLHLYYPKSVIDAYLQAKPTIASTYDVKGLIDAILKKPVGKAVGKLLSNVPNVTQVTYGRRKFDCVKTFPGVKADGALVDLYTDLSSCVSSLYSLVNNKRLWDDYVAGAAAAGGATFAPKTYVYDTDNPPVGFSQMGSYVGSPVRSYAEYQYTAFVDWGVNKFNSGSRTEIVVKEVEGNEYIVIPYTLGAISYTDYVQNHVPATLKDTFNADNVTGFSVSAKSIPFLAVKRAHPPTWLPGLYLDKQLLAWGPVSMLPVPPQETVSVIQGYDTTNVQKQVIGKYEASIDNIPFDFSHVDSIVAKSVPAKDSHLSEVLGVSKNYINGVGKMPSIMMRFINKAGGKDQPVTLVCPYIANDEFFKRSPGTVFYVPFKANSMDFEIVQVGYAYEVEAEGDLVLYKVTSQKIRIAKLMSEELSTIGRTVTKRVQQPLFKLPQICVFDSSPRRKDFDLTSDIT